MQVPVPPPTTVPIDTQELTAILQGLLEVYIDMVYETNELKRRVAELEHQLAARPPPSADSLLDISNVEITNLI
tara:strand:- start:254 stop:475 length:222 start_codon:yes stop_codon:yes gene_type:complete